VLHEALSLIVGKKMEKEVLVKLGEALRLPPGFRKVIARHPGIFYVTQAEDTDRGAQRGISEAYVDGQTPNDGDKVPVPAFDAYGEGGGWKG
jgi:hypothetical protein